ncbi:DUF3616 domain-containing protein [Pseudonocardia acaciae]|uniref:DUF3616 domain-containing protein n=1 Tax=Pseudonocardia acaciae TaxID=551276 RepID=UPI00048C818C|nr:DUF3616 domain-containing protein [Pseudonocardia acaciae]
MQIERRVPLRFHPDAVAAQTHVNLSAVRSDGRCLWLAGDETATVERLSPVGSGYGDQREFRLADLVELPGPPDEEADIEGLARVGGYLWATGSHSLVRKRVKDAHDDAKAIRRLGKVRFERNRFVIARLAVQDGAGGLPELVRRTEDGRTSALLGGPGERHLAEELADDEHLAPFLAIPAKDNGLDVEGLAVHGESLYIGLRGPVLRGFAVVLELDPVEDGPGRLRLGRVDGANRYRKHFLDLGGLGVRDLCPHGSDLLVLAGPSMDLDGPVRVYRWHDAAVADAPEVARGDELTVELELPYGDGDDHAEGIALLPGDGDPRLLVVYDSPAGDRLPEPEVVLADVVRLG